MRRKSTSTVGNRKLLTSLAIPEHFKKKEKRERFHTDPAEV